MSTPGENAARAGRPRHSTLSSDTLGALFWMFSGHGFRVVLRTVITIVLARLLAPADFGVTAAAFTVISFSEIFGLLGLGPALVQRERLEDRHIGTAFVFSLAFGLFMGTVLWLLAPAFALFFQNAQVQEVLRVAVLVFPFHGLGVVGESLLQRELRFRRLISIEVSALVVGYGLVGISAALAGWGVWALVAAALAQAAQRNILILVAQPHTKRLRFEPRAFAELISFGGGITVARFLNYLALQGDNLVVGRWLGMEALGLYTRAYSLVGTLSNLLGQALEKVLFPSMAKVQNQPQRLAVAYRRGVALTSLVLLPASVATWVLAPELIAVTLGPAWLGVVPPFRILALGMMLRTSYKIGVALASAVGAVYRSAWRQALYASLVIAGAWLGQHWGLSGVALGVLVALAIHFLSIAQFSISLLPYTGRQYLRAQLPAVWLSLVLGAEVFALASLLRSVSAPPILVLLANAVAVPVSILALVRFLPGAFFGEEAAWFLEVLLARLPRRLTRLWRKRVAAVDHAPELSSSAERRGLP